MSRRPHGLVPRLVFALVLLFNFASPQTPAQQLINNTAATFSNLEQEMIREINLARTGPAGYAAFLEQTRPFFTGKQFRRPGTPPLLTSEGVDALDDAIRFLRSATPLLPLEVSRGMCSGASALVSDQGATGATGHKGSDGSFCEARVERFGSWTGAIGENLSYGTDTARERIVTLIIDDGFSNRGHRMRIFDPRFKVAGVACGNHKEGPLCVVTFAGGFTERLSPKQPAATKRPAGKQQLPAGATQF